MHFLPPNQQRQSTEGKSTKAGMNQQIVDTVYNTKNNEINTQKLDQCLVAQYDVQSGNEMHL